MAASGTSTPKTSLRSGLLAKFLLVLVPVFLLCAVPGLAAIVHYELRADSDSLAARIGNLSARTASALSRYDVAANPQLGRDLMAPLAADRAFECAVLLRAGDLTPLIALPRRLQCPYGTHKHLVRLPVGTDGTLTLQVQFTDAEIARAQNLEHKIVLAVLVISIVCAVAAATIAFRYIVGAPLRKFTAAIRHSVDTGQRTKVEIARGDELGLVIAAFDEMQERDERREVQMKRTHLALTRSEGTLRRLNEELEDRVACRTAELEAEKGKAQADRDYLSAVLETVADAIIATDETGKILSCNRAAERLFGYQDADIIGSTIARLIPSQGQLRSLFAKCMPRPVGESRVIDDRVETTAVKRGGARFPVDITVTQMRYGGRTTAIIVLRDITERLESQRRLVEAKDQAESANRSKSLFLANMSHELRTPLNAMIGFSEAMQQKIFGALGHKRYEEYVDDIHASGEHLLQLINSVLDFSKIEAGAETLSEQEVDVPALIEECLRMMRPRSEAAGLALHVEMSKAPAMVIGDHTKLKQILVNLLGNAVKFTPAGGRIDVRVAMSDGGQALFEVEDNGIGMAKEEIPMALSRFGQVESGFSRRFEGTGLGLPLAKALVELHGGRLAIESRQDRGTTVTVRLPAHRVLERRRGRMQPAIQVSATS